MILSNKEVVDNIGSGIKSAASVCQLGTAKQVSDTEFVIQTQCEQGYSKASNTLKSLQTLMAENVETMQDIAANFDNVDEELAQGLRG